MANLFTVGRRAFQAVGSALGMTQTGAVLTQVDLEKAIAAYGLDPVIQAGLITRRTMVFTRVDVAGVNAAIALRPHIGGDWVEVLIRGVIVAAADRAVPIDHDAWVWGVGARVTVTGAFDELMIFRSTQGLVLGEPRGVLYGATFATDGVVFLDATLASPVHWGTLPWYIPAGFPDARTELQGILDTNAAVTTIIVLEVMSAPPGVIKMLP